MPVEVFPNFSDFSDIYKAGKTQVLYTYAEADTETPVSAYLKIAAEQSYSFLFESVEGGKFRGRYSFFGLDPDMICTIRGSNLLIRAHGHEDTSLPFAALSGLIDANRFSLPPELPGMAAGLFGFLGYDTIRQVEDLPDIPRDTLDIPDGVLVRPTLIGILDHVLERLTLATPVQPDDSTPELAFAAAYQRLHNILERLQASLPQPINPPAFENIEPTSSLSKTAFEKMVVRAKEYIKSGDVFQVVLSQRFSVPYKAPAFRLYRQLRKLNPSPYMFYLNMDDFQLVGSSPEILVRLKDNTVTVRPIAGTRPRGKDLAEDQQLAAALLADEKERAEHLMLIDLGRNDVGRIAEPGSVQMTAQYTIEYYSHVMHIVSEVQGKLAPGISALQALLAGFPAGTVSGAPKVRAMQIIDAMEPVKRAFYAGAVGYFSANGDMDTCIALRTALIKDGMLHVQAGAGIVADSDPHSEYLETCNKAMALLKAASI